MAIIRNNTRKKYTVIDNEIFKNKNLSLKARGMLATLLSLPDNWEFSENGLEQIFNDSLYKIKQSLTELEQLGYLKRNRSRNEKGQLKEMEYIVYEKPIFEIPTLVKPILVKPILVDLTQYNTNTIKDLNNKKLNNKEYFKNKEINELFIEFLSLRKKLKAINNDRAINMLINKLNKYDDDIKTKMIEKSLLNSWKDVYELKDDKYTKERNKQSVPDWFDKKVVEETLSTEEEAKMKAMLSEFS